MERRGFLKWWMGLVGATWIAHGFPAETTGAFPGNHPPLPPSLAPLPRDPFEAMRLENDVLGVRLWGPPQRPTLNIGKSDIWDRRWFEDRQPLVTLARINDLAMSDRLQEVAKDTSNTIYDLYQDYDFPCPKPGAQFILEAPFAEHTGRESAPNQSIRVVTEGSGKRLEALIWVALKRPLVVLELNQYGLASRDLRLRVYRHKDTILPGQPVDVSYGGNISKTDFEPLPAPRPIQFGDCWGIAQDFPPDRTFPGGFHVVVAATALDMTPIIEHRQDERDLGTPLWAEKEGRLNIATVKRYTPINKSPGTAATASFRALPPSLTILATVATTQDGEDVVQAAGRILADAREAGLDGLRREQAEARARGRRKNPAVARVGNETRAAAPSFVMPRLRRSDGFYGDVPLCSVDSTKFCFQDASIWHADFHFNEIRAEGMLTLGQFEELRPYVDMIRTLLPSACNNARDVYSLPGSMYPQVHFPLHSRGITHTNLTWEQDMGLNGLISKPLWLFYRYSGDIEFLHAVAYPVLRESARFCAAYLTEEPDGRLHVVPTVSPEHWGLTARFERNRDATSALTLIRYLLRAAASAANTLDCDPAEAAKWLAASNRMAPYPTFRTPSGPVWVDVAGAPPIEYNIPVPLSPVFWGDDVGLDSPPEMQALARRTLDQIRVWEAHRPYLDRCIRPRLGLLRPGAELGPENFLLSYQSLRVFPAVPADVEVTMENFRAEGGFSVSAVRPADSDILHVRIVSHAGGPCRLANPWPGRAVIVRRIGGETVVRTVSNATHIVFGTSPAGEYEARKI